MTGRLDATERGIYIRVEEDPVPNVGISGRSSRHAVAAVQAVDNGRGSALYAEGHSTIAGVPTIGVRGYGELLRIERWDGTKWVLSATMASDGTLDVEDLTIAGAPLVGGSLDSDLVDIAALTPSANDTLQYISGHWANRTVSQVKTTLSLNNVDNTSDANKPVSTATQAALDLKGDLAVTANSQSGTTYTLVIGDQGKVIECNNGSAITLTIPANASVAFPTGTIIEVYQDGAGQITIAAAGGVTLRAPGGAKTRVQYSTVTLRKRATDTWVLAGDTTS